MREAAMISERFVMDETGRRSTQCHGVPAWQWFEYARKAMTLLTKPEWRKANGITKVEVQNFCDDPDCKRLNRRMQYENPQRAIYYLERDIQQIRPVYESEREAFQCYGHPHEMGKYLCRNCAIVGTTKRLIQEAKDGTIHECGEGERGGTRGEDAPRSLRPKGNDRPRQDAHSNDARDC